jgi:hypothetical protein
MAQGRGFFPLCYSPQALPHLYYTLAANDSGPRIAAIRSRYQLDAARDPLRRSRQPQGQFHIFPDAINVFFHDALLPAGAQTFTLSFPRAFTIGQVRAFLATHLYYEDPRDLGLGRPDDTQLHAFWRTELPLLEVTHVTERRLAVAFALGAPPHVITARFARNATVSELIHRVAKATGAPAAQLCVGRGVQPDARLADLACTEISVDIAPALAWFRFEHWADFRFAGVKELNLEDVYKTQKKFRSTHAGTEFEWRHAGRSVASPLCVRTTAEEPIDVVLTQHFCLPGTAYETGIRSDMTVKEHLDDLQHKYNRRFAAYFPEGTRLPDDSLIWDFRRPTLSYKEDLLPLAVKVFAQCEVIDVPVTADVNFSVVRDFACRRLLGNRVDVSPADVWFLDENGLVLKEDMQVVLECYAVIAKDPIPCPVLLPEQHTLQMPPTSRVEDLSDAVYKQFGIADCAVFFDGFLVSQKLIASFVFRFPSIPFLCRPRDRGLRDYRVLIGKHSLTFSVHSDHPIADVVSYALRFSGAVTLYCSDKPIPPGATFGCILDPNQSPIEIRADRVVTQVLSLVTEFGEKRYEFGLEATVADLRSKLSQDKPVSHRFAFSVAGAAVFTRGTQPLLGLTRTEEAIHVKLSDVVVSKVWFRNQAREFPLPTKSTVCELLALALEDFGVIRGASEYSFEGYSPNSLAKTLAVVDDTVFTIVAVIKVRVRLDGTERIKEVLATQIAKEFEAELGPGKRLRLPIGLIASPSATLGDLVGEFGEVFDVVGEESVVAVELRGEHGQQSHPLIVDSRTTITDLRTILLRQIQRDENFVFFDERGVIEDGIVGECRGTISYCAREDIKAPKGPETPRPRDYEQLLLRLMELGKTDRRSATRCFAYHRYEFQATLDHLCG